MSKVLIKSSTLTDIANAIRAKDGSTAQMYPSEMAGKIGAISTGEKRIIPTKFYKTTATATGTGIQYVKAGSVTLDGKTYNIISEDTGYLRGIPVRFNNSASAGSGRPTIIGTETDVKLEGTPKTADSLYGFLMPDSGYSATGKGYAILHCTNSTNQIGAITIDGKQITSKFVLSNFWTIRFDFNKSIKLGYYTNIDSRKSPQWEVYIYE